MSMANRYGVNIQTGPTRYGQQYPHFSDRGNAESFARWCFETTGLPCRVWDGQKGEPLLTLGNFVEPVD